MKISRQIIDKFQEKGEAVSIKSVGNVRIITFKGAIIAFSEMGEDNYEVSVFDLKRGEFVKVAGGDLLDAKQSLVAIAKLRACLESAARQREAEWNSAIKSAAQKLVSESDKAKRQDADVAVQASRIQDGVGENSRPQAIRDFVPGKYRGRSLPTPPIRIEAAQIAKPRNAVIYGSVLTKVVPAQMTQVDKLATSVQSSDSSQYGAIPKSGSSESGAANEYAWIGHSATGEDGAVGGSAPLKTVVGGALNASLLTESSDGYDDSAASESFGSILIEPAESRRWTADHAMSESTSQYVCFTGVLGAHAGGNLKDFKSRALADFNARIESKLLAISPGFIHKRADGKLQIGSLASLLGTSKKRGLANTLRKTLGKNVVKRTLESGKLAYVIDLSKVQDPQTSADFVAILESAQESLQAVRSDKHYTLLSDEEKMALSSALILHLTKAGISKRADVSHSVSKQEGLCERTEAYTFIKWPDDVSSATTVTSYDDASRQSLYQGMPARGTESSGSAGGVLQYGHLGSVNKLTRSDGAIYQSPQVTASGNASEQPVHTYDAVPDDGATGYQIH